MPPLQYVAPAGGAPHVPSVLPEAMVQTPPQQSGPWVHVSPFWMQKDDAMEQWPPWQSCEQQSAFCAHVLPAVLQHELPPSLPAVADVTHPLPVLSDAQVPFVQVPLQQAPSELHSSPSDWQVPVEQ
jgi:hypothetical protein